MDIRQTSHVLGVPVDAVSFVGAQDRVLACPKQEHWMLAHLDRDAVLQRFEVDVIVRVGNRFIIS